MRSFPSLTLLFLLVQSVLAQGGEIKDALPTAPESKTWNLVWRDEFDGTKLDTTKWDIPEYKRRDG
jgi:hypothetical protein